MTDVKILAGNNRQCDLLAFHVLTKEQYHVESSVTHRENWSPSTIELSDIFDKKFRGVVPRREGSNTDYAKGKTYYDKIIQTYINVGFDPQKIQRVFITWIIKDEGNLENFLANYKKLHDIKILVWSFRDRILPKLIEEISTSNYDDEVLRTLSLLQQRELQRIDK
jgi:hypothetical protein